MKQYFAPTFLPNPSWDNKRVGLEKEVSNHVSARYKTQENVIKEVNCFCFEEK